MDPVIDGREARGGVIRPVGDPYEREQWPESIYLRVHHTDLAYTLESPSSLPLGRRVAALKAAVKAAVAVLRGEKPCGGVRGRLE
jgi:murein peptide amidase A